MSVYNFPVLHNGLLNSITNSTDMKYINTSTLSLATANTLFLNKITGGVVTGLLTVNNETVTSLTVTTLTDGTKKVATLTATNVSVTTSITVPAITFNTNTNTQTINQIGYYVNYVRAIAAGSIPNGTIATAGYCSYSLPGGVFMVQIYAYFSGTTIINLTNY